jgi:hypothetical protein
MKKFAALVILGVMFLSLAYSLPEVIAFGQVPPALSAPTNITNKPLTTVHELTSDNGFSARRAVVKQPDSVTSRWDLAVDDAADAAFRVCCGAGQKTLQTAIKINHLGGTATLGSTNRIYAESVLYCDPIRFFAAWAKAA